MASMWRRAMLYLGLGPDDEYDDYDDARLRRPAPPAAARQPPVAHVRPAARPEPLDRARCARLHPRDRPTAAGGDDPSAQPAVRRSSRSCRHGPSAKPYACSPTSFNAGAGGRRQVQGQPAGDREPPGRRPRLSRRLDRLRQRALLRHRRADGAGGEPGVPAHARQRRGLGRGAAAPPASAGSGLSPGTSVTIALHARQPLHPRHLRADHPQLVPRRPGCAWPRSSTSSTAITEPVLGPMRRAIPPIGMGGMGFDLSPIIVIVGAPDRREGAHPALWRVTVKPGPDPADAGGSGEMPGG